MKEQEFAGKPDSHLEFFDECVEFSKDDMEAAVARVQSSKKAAEDLIKARRERAAENVKHARYNDIERLLLHQQSDTRQARRRFKRLVEKYWPLTPNPETHPRLAAFVAEYEKRTK